jgi:hypothetical protein
MAEKNNFIDKYFNIKNSLLYFALFLLISAVSLYYINKIYSQGSNLDVLFSFPSSILISLFALLFFYFIFDASRLYFVLKT